MAGKRKLYGAAATAHDAKKRRLSEAKNSRPNSRESGDVPTTKVETVDLTDMDQYEAYETKQRREKREHDALEAQKKKEEAKKSKKLAEFECVICLDNPTDLVITHCGKWFMRTLLGRSSLCNSPRISGFGGYTSSDANDIFEF